MFRILLISRLLLDRQHVWWANVQFDLGKNMQKKKLQINFISIFGLKRSQYFTNGFNTNCSKTYGFRWGKNWFYFCSLKPSIEHLFLLTSIFFFKTLLLIIYNTLLMSSILIFLIKKIDFISIQWNAWNLRGSIFFFEVWRVILKIQSLEKKNWELAEPFPAKKKFIYPFCYTSTLT